MVGERKLISMYSVSFTPVYCLFLYSHHCSRSPLSFSPYLPHLLLPRICLSASLSHTRKVNSFFQVSTNILAEHSIWFIHPPSLARFVTCLHAISIPLFACFLPFMSSTMADFCYDVIIPAVGKIITSRRIHDVNCQVLPLTHHW